MTSPHLETFKAFLQDETTRESYKITDDDIATANLMRSSSNLMVELIRQMINKQIEIGSTRITAAHLHSVLNNRLK
ncbi:MAG: hypothetical protein H7240_12720 [Glaciimonas sp.]|nr:hypothetical protein [Glaciimonas sp.]